jgi:Mg2+-importing ATPase
MRVAGFLDGAFAPLGVRVPRAKETPSRGATPAPTTRPPSARGRWVSLAFGLAVFAAVVVFATHRSEERAFAQLVLGAQPAWLLLGLLLQLGTYLTDALIWDGVLRRAQVSRPLRSYVGLGLAKLFMDQAVPSVGLSGTLLVLRALDRRGVPRPVSMAAVVLDLLSYYAAYVLALLAAFAVVWADGDLTPWLAAPAGLFALLAAIVPSALLLTTRGHRLPAGVERLPFVRPAVRALGEATPALLRDPSLLARCVVLQLAILALDAGTLWGMLQALGLPVSPVQVFASFMLSTLARTLGVIPGGLGVFEAVSVTTLKLVGVPLAAGLAATLLFRGFSFFLPMAPGLVLARREVRAR